MKKCLSVLLAVVLLYCIVRAVPADASESPLAVIGAGSDFQYHTLTYDGVTYDTMHEANAALLEQILGTMKEEQPKLDDFFLLGDYDAQYYTAETSGKGLCAAREVLYRTYGLTDDQTLAVQGNHDPADTPGLARTGAHDRPHYGVYLINEDDFSWCGGNPDQAKATAAKLKAYLDQKSREGWIKPIFVLNHLPLHHSSRVGQGADIADNRYSRALVDVLNEAGEQGLQIYYLFGHNHSGTYDAYLGSDCICLTPGQTMAVTDPEKGTIRDFQSIRRNFTYLNAGYLGYVNGDCTATVFRIYEDRVELYRYGEKGRCSLKKPGYSTASDGAWGLDTTSLCSPLVQSRRGGLWMSLSADTLEKPLTPGQTARLKLTLHGGTAEEILWESQSPAVAAVTAGAGEATVTAAGMGMTRIRVTLRSSDGDVNTLTMPVTVILPGDVSQDGRVNIIDVAQLYGHVRNKTPLSGFLRFSCGKVTGDGEINIIDVALLYTRVKQAETKTAPIRHGWAQPILILSAQGSQMPQGS